MEFTQWFLNTRTLSEHLKISKNCYKLVEMQRALIDLIILPNYLPPGREYDLWYFFTKIKKKGESNGEDEVVIARVIDCRLAYALDD